MEMLAPHSILRSAFLVIVCFLQATHGAYGFDTGHHHDLTASAMRSLGFKSKAIKVAQLENWLVDYYSTQPLAGLKDDLAKLHFDNLEDSTRVRVYWSRLKVNAKTAFEKAAKDKAPLRVVALLGMSLHAVQDFYTHSDWVEQHTLPATGYLTDTYFDNASLASGALRTGSYPNQLPIKATDHGDGTSGAAGMNHDAYTRVRWDRAYVHAFCASRQWIEAARLWVEGMPGGEEVWEKSQNLALSAEGESQLDRDLRFAYQISQYAPGGHWKGPGSDSNLEFAASIAAFAGTRDSIFAKHFKDAKWHEPLVVGLELVTPPNAEPIMPAMSHPYVAVVVKTLEVTAMPVGAFEPKIDPGGKPDFFAKITVDDQVFTESLQFNSESFSPSWTSIAFVPTSQATVAIRYELWDEDGGSGGEDDQCDIVSVEGENSLSLTFHAVDESLSGDLNGIHNTNASAAMSGGKAPDKDRVRIKLAVYQISLLPQ